jgi:hypothetical protein
MRPAAAAFAICLLWGGPAALGAQRITGTVVDEASRRAVAAVDIALLDSAGVRVSSVLADSAGAFAFPDLAAGRYGLRAERLGYQTTFATDIDVARDERVIVELRLGIDAIPVEPIIVSARRIDRPGRLDEFYERFERRRRAGFGHFITREDIEHSAAFETADLLRMVPGVSVTGRGRDIVMGRLGGGCSPAIFLDGVMMNRTGPASISDYVSPQMIEAIEVYRGAAESPALYDDRGGCGSVLVWTRVGRSGGNPFSWRRVAVAAGFIFGMLLITR